MKFLIFSNMNIISLTWHFYPKGYDKCKGHCQFSLKKSWSISHMTTEEDLPTLLIILYGQFNCGDYCFVFFIYLIIKDRPFFYNFRCFHQEKTYLIKNLAFWIFCGEWTLAFSSTNCNYSVPYNSLHDFLLLPTGSLLWLPPALIIALLWELPVRIWTVDSTIQRDDTVHTNFVPQWRWCPLWLILCSPTVFHSVLCMCYGPQIFVSEC